jgi:hypothetical protein
MTLFMPVTEVPQAVNSSSASAFSTQASQAQSLSVAEESRIAITGMLKQLPNSPDTQILREEFQSLHAQLAGVKDNTAAEVMIDDKLNALSQRVMVAPNSQQIMEVLFNLREGKYNQQAENSLGHQRLSTLFSSQDKQWGWLS